MASPREAWRQARAHITETEQASLERAWDLKEKENTLEAKQQRLNAISADIEAGKRRLSQHVSQCNDYMKKILDLQKDFKEADKQRTDLVQMRTDIAKKLKEKEDDLSSQTAAFEKEKKVCEDNVAEFTAFLEEVHGKEKAAAMIQETRSKIANKKEASRAL
ncbi:g7431 [Coccomyxa viridis]|uniref:G7431 protein n=1 Tax=Coccomyxa viridis TaxID=1274662 RepID=A0ABP1FXW2_9CHLO